MSEHEIQQRIQYLVEHGGLYDDPLADIRRQVRWALAASSAALAVCVIELVLAYM